MIDNRENKEFTAKFSINFYRPVSYTYVYNIYTPKPPLPSLL